MARGRRGAASREIRTAIRGRYRCGSARRAAREWNHGARSTPGRRPGQPLRRAPRSRLPRARPDSARRRDRLRRPRARRPSSRSAGPTSRSRRRYRLERRDDEARFGYAVGPHSWKQFLFPPRVRLWRARRARRARSRSRRSRPTSRRSRSSACAPASCTRSRSRTGSSSSGQLRRPRLRRPARGRVRRRRQLLRARRHVLLRLDGHRPEGGGGLRPRADRAPRRRAPLPRRGRQRARRRACSPSCPRRAATSADLDAAGAAVDGAAAQMGRDARRDRPPRPARRATSSTRAGTRSPSAASPAATARSSARPASARASRTRPTSTGERAERSRVWDTLLLGRPLLHPRRQHPAVGRVALPAVADAQVRHLARPVRLVGLRRLRPVHHLVPGRDRHHRGAGRDPRDAKEAAMRHA